MINYKCFSCKNGIKYGIMKQYITIAHAATLSKRSKNPPCPGNFEPESLTRAARLITDSNASPTTLDTPNTSPIKINAAQVLSAFTLPDKGNDDGLSAGSILKKQSYFISIPKNNIIPIPAIIAPKNPAHVLFGLITGINLGVYLPNTAPNTNAPVSAVHATTKTIVIYAVPYIGKYRNNKACPSIHIINIPFKSINKSYISSVVGGALPLFQRKIKCDKITINYIILLILAHEKKYEIYKYII